MGLHMGQLEPVAGKDESFAREISDIKLEADTLLTFVVLCWVRPRRSVFDPLVLCCLGVGNYSKHYGTLWLRA